MQKKADDGRTNSKGRTMTARSSVSNFPALVVMMCLCSLLLSFVAFVQYPRKWNAWRGSPNPEWMAAFMSTTTTTTAAAAGDGNHSIRHPMGLKPLESRGALGGLLTEMGFRRGAEVGVQKGLHSQRLLEKWHTCEYFALIDLWEHQENYKDGANVNDEAQQSNMEEAKANVAAFESRTRTEFFKMTSVEASRKFEDDSFDFVYIDARHDFCGVMEDLVAFWPKLRRGGVLAGHDFHYAVEVETSDWSVCMDGSVHPGAVRGAVEEFALRYGLTVSVMYKEEKFFSWMVQKPWY